MSSGGHKWGHGTVSSTWHHTTTLRDAWVARDPNGEPNEPQPSNVTYSRGLWPCGAFTQGREQRFRRRAGCSSICGRRSWLGLRRTTARFLVRKVSVTFPGDFRQPAAHLGQVIPEASSNVDGTRHVSTRSRTKQQGETWPVGGSLRQPAGFEPLYTSNAVAHGHRMG